MPRSTRYLYAWRLEKNEGDKLYHSKLLHPIGFTHYVSRLRSPPLASRLLAGRWRRTELPLPFNNYLRSVTVLDVSEVLVVWYAPEGSPVSAEELPGDVEVAVQLPVENCTGRIHPNPSVKEMESHGRRAWQLLRMHRVRVRSPILPLLLAAVLDTRPMLPLSYLRSALKLLEDSNVDIKLRYVQRYYAELSNSHVIGRVIAWGEWRGLPLLIEAPRECLEYIYGYAAATLRGANIFVTPERVYAPLMIDSGMLEGLRTLQRICQGLRIRARLAAHIWTVPYHMMDPVTGKWREEPIEELVRLLEKLRLAASNQVND